VTCEEFRKLAPIPAKDVSRAERAAIFRHLLECDECNAMSARDYPVTAKLRRELIELTDSDAQDEEFRKVAFGENCVGYFMGMPVMVDPDLSS